MRCRLTPRCRFTPRVLTCSAPHKTDVKGLPCSKGKRSIRERCRTASRLTQHVPRKGAHESQHAPSTRYVGDSDVISRRDVPPHPVRVLGGLACKQTGISSRRAHIHTYTKLAFHQEGPYHTVSPLLTCAVGDTTRNSFGAMRVTVTSASTPPRSLHIYKGRVIG